MFVLVLPLFLSILSNWRLSKFFFEKIFCRVWTLFHYSVLPWNILWLSAEGKFENLLCRNFLALKIATWDVHFDLKGCVNENVPSTLSTPLQSTLEAWPWPFTFAIRLKSSSSIKQSWLLHSNTFGKEEIMGAIKSHIEINHLQDVAIPCNQCKKTFRSRNSLTKHNNVTHKQGT